ncbi:MAG: DUF87 domain-containing protein [Acidobacteriota bacterium]|nr:DUF87 domain-containing protein [Blastocatellia bacterium]MDW8411581.1 DUF87 domain-containing protein [Acidobacteriota bacterium]
MREFFDSVAMRRHPLRVLQEFLEREQANEKARNYHEMRFVGYVLDISYSTVTIITSDPYKVAVGGIPRNSLLIMTPAKQEEKIAFHHFTLLRVLDAAPTPLSKETQKTYFELQKKSMPELDVFTQAELQWGALNTEVLGMFYPHPEKQNAVEFSGDMNNFVSAHKYCVYAPDAAILDLVINSLVPEDRRFEIGTLRLTECRLPLQNRPLLKVPVYISPRDFLASRTAMFGKTRLGKSNVVKLIAQSILDSTEQERNVGQLIFDINGEYANDNPQDDSKSLRSANPHRCVVYAFTSKAATPSRPLKLNFYEQPSTALSILANLISQDKRDTSDYIRRFMSVELLPLEEIKQMDDIGEQVRAYRRIQMFWAVLKKAGFQVNEKQLSSLIACSAAKGFDPGFSQRLRKAAYSRNDVPSEPRTLDELLYEMEVIARFRRNNSSAPELISQSSDKSKSKQIFDAHDVALLEFLEPQQGRSGTAILEPYRIYHDPQAGDFVKEILNFLDEGQTVIIDLGNAHPVLLEYFSDLLSKEVFRHQVDKFSNDKLGNRYVQLYFEEAHNLFPRQKEPKDIYSRFAKEGAKYHIGVVYSTQSPSTISGDLLAQTENFFVAHMSSREEVDVLAKMNVAYESMKEDILRTKTPGYIRMLTRSHRFVVPIQALRFKPRKN